MVFFIILFNDQLFCPIKPLLNGTLTRAPTDREHLTGSARYQAVRTNMSTRINRATRPISWMSRMILDTTSPASHNVLYLLQCGFYIHVYM